MPNKTYQFYNNSIGWLVFSMTAAVYLTTMEPTTSLWDCGEFIAAAYKLQVVHPPGAPFFLMLNRLSAMLAPGPDWVAAFVNGTSALAGAFTVLFLFWSITLLGLKCLGKKAVQLGSGEMMAILGSGLVGSLALTFSDTFWFSATESEVYALSSLFMALVFWLILKWENRVDHPGHWRYLLLIAFLVGLSIGVHLLSLLVIPALAFVYFFRLYCFSWKGFFITGLIGLGILLFINHGLIRWLPSLAAKVELIFVNELGLPFWSGIYFLLTLIAGGLIYGIYHTYRHHQIILNLALTGILLIMAGYSTYTMVVIRSHADPAIDMNNPETVFNLISYLNREQYGDRPLFYGPQFTAEVIDQEKGAMQYKKGKSRYIPLEREQNPVFDPAHQTFFPRMTSRRRQDRMQFYREWENLEKGEMPGFSENLHFFLTYQVGHMWWRYFAWNFIGRQNDLQGSGQEFHKGHWITGIRALDHYLTNTGPQKNMPETWKNNPGRNCYYGLPFLLGLLGLVFHFRRDRKSAFTVLVFFLMTGIVLIIYLNNPPLEPRERDYTFVGSFYAFALWIGLGTLALSKLFAKGLPLQRAAMGSTLVSLVFVPATMATSGWDDHDRSNRYFPRSLAYNYLESCGKDGILFTSGDNETYPLWYLREVEGIREDLRIINLNLLSTHWYHENLRQPVNGADGLNFSIPREKVSKTKREYLSYHAHPSIDDNRYYDLQQILDFMTSDAEADKAETQKGTKINFMPTKKFQLPVNRQSVIRNEVLASDNQQYIQSKLRWQYPSNAISKGDLLLLDIVANTPWERPLQFSVTSGRNSFAGLAPYFRMDGLTYRLVPVKKDQNLPGYRGWMNPNFAYDLLKNQYKWGNLPEDNVYLDEVMRNQARNYRNIFNQVAAQLILNGQKSKAIKLLDHCLNVIPENNLPYDFVSFVMVRNYYRADAPDKGKALAQKVAKTMFDRLQYYHQLQNENQKAVRRQMQNHRFALKEMMGYAGDHDQRAWKQTLQKKLSQLQ